MPDIRYVCLSDMHLGEEDSLLTQLVSGQVAATEPSPVLVSLAECLKWLISNNEVKERKPTLILNGDIPEIALTTVNQALMAFECFVRLVMPEEETFTVWVMWASEILLLWVMCLTL